MPLTMQPKRILAIKLADLGDLLTITPALQAIRAAHPQARLDLLVPPGSAHLLSGSPIVDEVIAFDKFAFDTLGGIFNLKALARTLTFLLKLRARRYDTLLLFHHLTLRWGATKFRLVSLSSGASIRAGLDNGRGGFLTHKVKDCGFGARHEVEYWLDVASLVGGDSRGGWRSSLPVSDGDRTRATELLADLRGSALGPLVAIHAGAGWYSLARIWPAERFAAVARGLMRSRNAAIVLLGGPDDVEQTEHLQRLIGAEGCVLNLSGRTSIHETAAILEQCDLLVGNDSGPMHIAAAMQTPVVAVFGPSNHRAWGPYTPPGEEPIHTIVSRELPCQPCFYRAHSLGLREGCGPRPCLTGLSADPVLVACMQTLNKAVK